MGVRDCKPSSFFKSSRVQPRDDDDWQRSEECESGIYRSGNASTEHHRCHRDNSGRDTSFGVGTDVVQISFRTLSEPFRAEHECD
jgi:hypothetical protein